MGDGASEPSERGSARKEGASAWMQRTLKAAPFFAHASRATRQAAVGGGQRVVAAGGTVMIKQGNVPDALLVIGRGRARIERMAPDGRVVPLGYRGSGELLGESCLAHATEHAENVIAMEEVTYVHLPLPLVETLLAEDAGLGPAVLALLLARRREIEDRVESLLFDNVEERLVEFLLRAAERWGVPTPRGTLISAPITHLEMAQTIGSTRETVTLTLGVLRRAGLIEVAGRRLILKDREALVAR